MNTFAYIQETVDAMQDQLVAQRRDFHKYAEPSWLEMRTSSIIARQLTDLGYEVLTGEQVCKKESRMGVPEEAVLEASYERAVAQGADPEFVQATRGGMTGVIGILRCGEGPTVAMRFDIDSLYIFEASDDEHFPAREGFASVNTGYMHACGHDCHATIGLGVAKMLMQIKDQLHGTVKLIFQPAEECVGGAKPIVDNGHLDDVQYFLGAHTAGLDPKMPEAAITPGCYGHLAITKFKVTYHGKSAHAGNPHNGNNAMLSAATAILNLHAIPRHGSGATRINVGVVHGGSAENIIADMATMIMEVRGATTKLNDYMAQYARRVLESAAQMHGCTCEVEVLGSAETMTNDDELCLRLQKLCREELGMIVTDELKAKTGGSEDVTYMVNRVHANGGLATVMRARGLTACGAHNPRFDCDEVVLPNMVKVFSAAVYDLLK